MSESLHIIVHHRHDPDKPWHNIWKDDLAPDPRLLKSIQTKPVLLRLCQAAQENESLVYVHRTRLKGKLPRVLCCTAKVEAVDLVTEKVRFTAQVPLMIPPTKTARQGQIYYWA